jgi:hypothetical protein
MSNAITPAAKPTLTRVGWIPDEGMDYAAWAQEGDRIGSFARATGWWLGDWLNFGTKKWGERYAKAAKITGYDPKTLRNMRYVASRFDLSLRRDNLTWSHHALIASLAPDERPYWLDRATNESFSVDDLRMELRWAQRQRQREADVAEAAADIADDAAPDGPVLCPKCGYEIGVDAVAQEA